MEKGIVSESGHGGIVVKASPHSGCASCAMAGRCHIGSSSLERTLFIRTAQAFSPGDEVYFTIEPRGRVGMSLILFALPVLLLVAGALAGNHAGAGYFAAADTGGILGGLAGLLLSAPLVWAFSRRVRHHPLFEPHLCEPGRKDETEAGRTL